jgi:hypothetical protein
MFKKLIASDNAVKTIFDHYKNFAVAAVILAIGFSLLTEEQGQGFWDVMRILSGTCIVVVGASLVIINERHGIRKLNEAKLNVFVHFAVLLVYSLSMISIVSRLVLHNFK